MRYFDDLVASIIHDYEGPDEAEIAESNAWFALVMETKKTLHDAHCDVYFL